MTLLSTARVSKNIGEHPYIFTIGNGIRIILGQNRLKIYITRRRNLLIEQSRCKHLCHTSVTFARWQHPAMLRVFTIANAQNIRGPDVVLCNTCV